MIKASVIIPVHNAEKTLRKCVESLVYGKEREIELVLVEDHSGDSSWQLCRELAESFPRVRCFRNTDRPGVSATRNIGLEHAQGEYLLFVDSDDWVSGSYASTLLTAAAAAPEHFALCGYTFIDRVAGNRQDYVYDSAPGAQQLSISFGLWEKILLQQLWNKTFLRSVVEKAHLRFDEKLSMGEDFAFVLEYLKESGIHTCTVINEALYYYIRHNTGSLMGKFGVSTPDMEFRSLRKLANICTDADVQERYERALTRAKNNSVYHLCRNPGLSKAEKLSALSRLVGAENADRRYRREQLQSLREKLWSLKRKLSRFPSRWKNRILRFRRDRIAAKARAQLSASDFTVISQNCIGGVFCHDMGMQFLSPTVNLFFSGPDFVRFAGDLPRYMEQELQMQWGEEYPIGYLDDVRVNFMHYDNCTEARETWERRKARIRWDRILILATDMEGFDDACYEAWRKLSYPKVLFSAKDRGGEDCVFYPQYSGMDCVPDLIPGREFYRGGVLMKTINSLQGE